MTKNTPSLEAKLDNLMAYLFNKEKYSEDLKASIRSNLFDFTIILIWKAFMLFIYEKLYQIPPDVILDNWEKKYPTDKRPKGYKKNNLYWPNNIDDCKLLDLLYEIYDIDKNVVRMARSLAQKRDTAAHVSEITFNISQVDSFLDDILNLCQKIQNAHEAYLDQINLITIDEDIIIKSFSSHDVKYFLPKLIELLKNSRCFNETEKIEEKLLILKNYLSKDDIKKILDAIKESSADVRWHQILQASKSSQFLMELYKLYSEPALEWKEFAEFLKEDKLKKHHDLDLDVYNWIIEIFRMETVKKEKHIHF